MGRAEESEESGAASDGVRAAELAALKDAVRILWGESRGDAAVAEAVPALTDVVDPPGYVRVAAASNSGEELDGHFGSCARFLIYRVSAEGFELLDTRSTASADQADDRNAHRVQLIRDCKILYVGHIGGPASAKVIKADIHLVQVKEGGHVPALLERLCSTLAGTPPPWLSKVVNRRSTVLE
jgi:nitrogen fixation protein NifX